MNQVLAENRPLVDLEPLAIFRNYSGMVEAFRSIKDQIGLSNVECENICDLTNGYVDKVLGPSRVHNIGPFTFDVFCELFAVEFVMRFNPAAVARMKPRWGARDDKNVREYPTPAFLRKLQAMVASELAAYKPGVRKRQCKICESRLSRVIRRKREYRRKRKRTDALRG